MQISDNQLKVLKNIEHSFSTTLIDRHFNGDSKAAVSAFSQALTLSDKFQIAVAALIYKKLSSENNTITAKRLLNYCDKAVPALTKVFGEKSLVDALPEDARNQEILDISRKLGGCKVAHLVGQSF